MIDDDIDTNFLIDHLLSKLPYVDEYFIKIRVKYGFYFLSTCHIPLTYIFVKINMPEMDGFEFVEKYKRDFMEKFLETAVYFLTSLSRQSDKQKAINLIL